MDGVAGRDVHVGRGLPLSPDKDRCAVISRLRPAPTANRRDAYLWWSARHTGREGWQCVKPLSTLMTNKS